jgi:hypothetical protein
VRAVRFFVSGWLMGIDPLAGRALKKIASMGAVSGEARPGI